MFVTPCPLQQLGIFRINLIAIGGFKLLVMCSFFYLPIAGPRILKSSLYVQIFNCLCWWWHIGFLHFILTQRDCLWLKYFSCTDNKLLCRGALSSLIRAVMVLPLFKCRRGMETLAPKISCST